MIRPRALAAAFLLGGCTMSFGGPSQSVAVTTPGTDSADCTLSSPDTTYRVVTPATVIVQKTEHDLQIVCRKDGYQDGVATLASSYEGGSIWTSFLGVVGLGEDDASGGQNGFPPSISIPMWQKSAVTTAPSTQTPAAAPALQPVAMSEYGVRFGAYESPDGAQRGWAEIWNQYWQQLSGMEPQMVTSQASGGATRYHLYGRGLTRERAESLCFYLQQSGQPCEAVRF